MSRIPILMYHSIDSSGSVISISKEEFASHLGILKEKQFEVVPLTEALQLIQRNLPADRKVALTFDDGFENFYTDAFPLLSQYNWTATVFLVSGYCGKDNSWPGQSTGIPRLPLLNWSQITEMQKQGIEFGAHSVSHPDLTRISPENAAIEITRCNEEFQQKSGKAVPYFAYPYGSTNKVVENLVRKRYQAALGTNLSAASTGENPYLLSRVDVYYLKGRFELVTGSRLSSYLAARNLARRFRRKLVPY